MKRRSFVALGAAASFSATSAQARKCPPAAKGMRFYVEKDKAGKFRWQLKSRGDIIADSGQGYETRQGCAASIERVKTCWNAEVEG
jgi:uncharacterized protein YegP (UPF0339 family)